MLCPEQVTKKSALEASRKLERPDTAAKNWVDTCSQLNTFVLRNLVPGAGHQKTSFRAIPEAGDSWYRRKSLFDTCPQLNTFVSRNLVPGAGHPKSSFRETPKAGAS